MMQFIKKISFFKWRWSNKQKKKPNAYKADYSKAKIKKLSGHEQ